MGGLTVVVLTLVVVVLGVVIVLTVVGVVTETGGVTLVVVEAAVGTVPLEQPGTL